MLIINFSGKSGCPFSEEMVKNIAEVTAKFENKIKGEVEINLVGNRKIKEINRIYRGKDCVTDVLSFSWQEGNEAEKNYLGQIFISCDKIKTQAKEYGVPAEEEFVRMLVHGLLHLVGYDHIEIRDEKKMFGLQEKIISKIIGR